MSWDITLTVDGIEVYSQNYTHNTNGAIRAAGVDWSQGALNGMTAAQLRKHVQPFLEAVITRPNDFDQYDADNGWGWVRPRSSGNGCSVFTVILDLAAACDRHPEAIVGTWF